MRLILGLGHNSQPDPILGLLDVYPNIPTIAHPMRSKKLTEVLIPNREWLMLPEIPVVLNSLLLLPAPLGKCLPFVHLCNLFGSSGIVRILVIPDPYKPREPEGDPTFIDLMAQRLVDPPANRGKRRAPLLAPQCKLGSNSNRPSGPPTQLSAQTRYQALLHPQ